MSKRINVGKGKKDFPDAESLPDEGLDAAILAAWENVKAKGEIDDVDAAGRYKVEIFIETINPIISYSAEITPVD